MIVTLNAQADLATVRQSLAERGLWVQVLRSESQTLLQVEPCSAAVPARVIRAIDGVQDVAEPTVAHPRVAAQGPSAQWGEVRIGGDAAPVVMAGPCSVESEAQIHAAAERLAPLGVRFLRGGAYKPRTSPYSFQGHGADALRWMRRAADSVGLKVVTEVMSPDDVQCVAEHADVLQVGSRNMQNFALLRAIGSGNRPVLLKRGMAASVDEWLHAGEYVLLHGAPTVVFCERGIRGFDPQTRNLLDLGAVALLRHVHQVPVVVDPSHATGRRDLVAPLARAAVAAGAAGLLVETHDRPGEALSDGPQALLPEQLAELVGELGVAPLPRQSGQVPAPVSVGGAR